MLFAILPNFPLGRQVALVLLLTPESCTSPHPVSKEHEALVYKSSLERNHSLLVYISANSFEAKK